MKTFIKTLKKDWIMIKEDWKETETIYKVRLFLALLIQFIIIVVAVKFGVLIRQWIDIIISCQ